MTDSGLLQAYREHEWELLRFLARRLGSPAMAADIAHDLYAKLLGQTQPPQIRDSKAYLFGMAAIGAASATGAMSQTQQRRQAVALAAFI